MKSRSLSEETKEKISRACLGQKRSDEVKERMRLSALGHEVTRDAREKIGRANQGRVRSNEFREKMRLANTGRRLTPETLEKLRLANLGRQPPRGEGKVSWYDYVRKDGRIVKLQGSYELTVAKYLDEIGEEWECVNRSKEHSFLLSTGQRYYPDFYLKRLDLYIDPKGWIRPWDEEKYKRIHEEYPSRVVFLIGDTYLDQLREVLSHV